MSFPFFYNAILEHLEIVPNKWKCHARFRFLRYAWQARGTVGWQQVSLSFCVAISPVTTESVTQLNRVPCVKLAVLSNVPCCIIDYDEKVAPKTWTNCVAVAIVGPLSGMQTQTLGGIWLMQGWMDYDELRHNWIQKGRVMAHWNPTLEPKPCDFLGKFLCNID